MRGGSCGSGETSPNLVTEASPETAVCASHTGPLHHLADGEIEAQGGQLPAQASQLMDINSGTWHSPIWPQGRCPAVKQSQNKEVRQESKGGGSSESERNFPSPSMAAGMGGSGCTGTTPCRVGGWESSPGAPPRPCWVRTQLVVREPSPGRAGSLADLA